MKRRILWLVLGLMSLLLVLPVEQQGEEPGWFVKVILWIDEHMPQGGEQGGEQGEDPPPEWHGGHSPDWDE